MSTMNRCRSGCQSCGRIRNDFGCLRNLSNFRVWSANDSGLSGCNCGCNCGCNNAQVTDDCGACNFGALNCIAGPFNRCGNLTTSNNFPFFTGPCGPVRPCRRCCCPTLPCTASGSCCNCGCGAQNCGCDGSATQDGCCNRCGCNSTTQGSCCNNNCKCNCNCGCDCDVCNNIGASASLGAQAPITQAAGGTVTLSPTLVDPSSFAVSEGGVRILCAGTYLISYTVNIPNNQAVTNQFYLALNGARIPSSTLEVATIANATSASFSTQVLVQAPADSLLTLVATDALNITAGTTLADVFSLSITRIS